MANPALYKKLKTSVTIKSLKAILGTLIVIVLTLFVDCGFAQPTSTFPIAFQSGTNGYFNTGGTTRIISFNVSGMNTLLVVGWAQDGGYSVTSVTYNGVPMTLIGDQSVTGTGLRTGMFYLLNPSPGIHDLVLTRNTTITTMDYTVALYTGVRQYGQPDAKISGTVGGTATPSPILSTIADNCWIVGASYADGPTLSVGPNSYLREQSPDQHDLFDSNGALSAGSHSLPLNLVNSGNTGWVLASFAPAPIFDTWTIRNPGVIGDFRGLGYAKGLYVLTGTQGELVTSPDAVNWTRRDSGDSTWLSDVAYGNNTFVIVGQNGKLLTSADGMSWRKQPSGTTANFNQVSFANGQFFAVGDRGTIATSFDGIDWAFRDSGIADTNSSTGTLYEMVYGNGIYVIGSQSSTILTSVDTIHWTAVDLGRPSPSIVFGNGIFVLIGLQGDSYCAPQTSADGVTWTIQAGLNTRAISPVAFGQGTFLGFSGNVSHGIAESMWSSADGTNWVNRPCPTTNGIWNCKYLNYTFMAVGENGTIIQTPQFSPPVITQQLVNESIQQGATTNFEVAAVGTMPISYQWRFSPINFAAQMDLPGQTNAQLTLTNVAAESAGAYSVRVSNNLGSIVSSNAILFVQGAPDTDRDGIPDYWEALYGLNPANPTDATTHAIAGGQTNQLTYLQAYFFRLDPTSMDSDGDGVSDYDEIFKYGTNPLKADTDGDGIPDGWEIAHHMNPLLNDSTRINPSGVANLQIYYYDLDPAHTNKLDPRNPFDLSNPLFPAGMGLYEVVNRGMHTNNNYYDHNDRLVGVEYSRGVSIAYAYDGNDNLVRQTVLSRIAETNGVPVLWQFLHGLTNYPSAFMDSDGDGWTDYQEWIGGSDPANPQRTPNLIVNPGANIATLALPFTPSNFVLGVGQLDGVGTEEIVIGSDGNPGTNDNFLLILTQAAVGWTTQRVSVGAFGISSIVVGQPANRPGAGIYVALHNTNGLSKMMEFGSSGGIWQSNLLAMATNSSAFLVGLRNGRDVLGNFSPTDGPANALYGLAYTNGFWTHSLLSSNSSQRVAGGIEVIYGGITRSGGLRLLDSGGIEVSDIGMEFLDNRLLIPTNSFYYSGSDKWYFSSPSNLMWHGADNYCNSLGGFLVTIASAEEDRWLATQFPFDFHMGLTAPEGYRGNDPSVWYWLSGADTAYRNWVSGQPSIGIYDIWSYHAAYKEREGPWGVERSDVDQRPGIGEFRSAGGMSILPEPAISTRFNWNYSSLLPAANRASKSNGFSILYACINHKRQDDLLSVGDEFLFQELTILTNGLSVTTLDRTPIGATRNSRAYGLASADITGMGEKIPFTAEPDGQVFYWLAANSNAPLERHLFSSDYSGKAWHSVASVDVGTLGQALVGLLVDPTNQSLCNVIFWAPQSVLPSLPPNSIETPPTVIVLPATNVLAAMAMVPFRLWDAEGNASTPFLQYQYLGTTMWKDATITKLDDLPFNQSNRVSALPTGISHTLTWDTTGDLGSVRTNVLLRASAQDFLLRGDWSLPVPYVVDTRPPFLFNTGTNDLHQTKSGFQFSLSGGNGSSSIIIYASTNLLDWKPIFTNPPFLGMTQYLDPAAILYPARFYRAAEQ